ncbi:hypothetical protein K432DRAFT_23799 [Lepidopterella palustris CBS 459.81]|uniref:Frequency clock protein n=1 Tax=Lepidopterella palustris CBS 459.81 TaxID=1314670 RepID=A0A8E2JG80_9PEZI|nr:hypothetical protein K432DRAFT_23799 [Lepidopterella palustris CBS 459.81]
MSPGNEPPDSGHPRRPPGHKSVSLRHAAPKLRTGSGRRFPHINLQLPEPAPRGDSANPPSSPSSHSPKLRNHKQSSGESSDTGKWFDNSNNHVARGNASFVDNDPPFYLRNSSSSETPPEPQEQRLAMLQTQSTAIPYRPGFMNIDTEESSAEDFRGVIDDLTIANRKLKQKLRKYEKLYDDRLQDEKLFEVRFHGLADDKKKELEDTLRKFAMSLNESPESGSPTVDSAPPADHKPTSPHMSARFAESGYASMSVYGQNSTSAPSTQNVNIRKLSKAAFTRQQQNVHSYLHDISAGLIPKQSAAMSEKSKKKLIVRRLEQIFAGKLPTSGNHPQPLQQQEVAQSAALADRRAKEASGQRARQEGLREARIMPPEEEDVPAMGQEQSDMLQHIRPSIIVAEQGSSGSGSPDQRPTRPLDLDPYRAQVPSDNMSYIRHLGFTPPDMVSGDAPEDGHGWIYLNLLINMAQLHTISVTPGFVKDAVSEYSAKFEISEDGRKLRWKGGHDVTRTSSDSSSEQLSSSSPDEKIELERAGRKRSRTNHNGSGVGKAELSRQGQRSAKPGKERDKDFYNVDQVSSSYSELPAHPLGDSPRLGSTAVRNLSSRRRPGDGPIIFYNKAKFFTDLSGDRISLPISNPTSYNRFSSRPVGVNPSAMSTMTRIAELNEPKGLFEDSPLRAEDVDMDYSPSSEVELAFSAEAMQDDGSSNGSAKAIDFEASGIGGVEPGDNFAINVKMRQQRVDHQAAVVAVRRTVSKPKPYTRRILDALGKGRDRLFSNRIEDENTPVISKEIISTSHKDLPSSALPPASFLRFDSTSSGDVDSDLESDVSSSPSTTSNASDPEPVINLQLLNILPTHNGTGSPAFSSASISDEEEDDDDESRGVDILAASRVTGLAPVLASEREYDPTMAGQLADDIPAGSSAATAGGGSGFNSPDSPVAGDDAHAIKQSTFPSGSGAVARSHSLKRARTGDSLATMLQPGKAAKLE